MNLNNITISQYLTEKGVAFRETNGELITKCIFGPCDKDSRGNEAHLYFNKETSQYECKKCGEKGNLVTLRKHFGDTSLQQQSLYRGPRFSDALVEKCHQNLPAHIREYLRARGIKNDV